MGITTMENRRSGAFEPSLEEMIDHAVALYGTRVTDNIDLSRSLSSSVRAWVLGNALMEHGDLRAFVMGRELVAASGR